MDAEPLLLPGGAVWMPIALGELGTREIHGKDHEARVLEYHATTTLRATTDEVPWCSSFVNWVMESSGIPGTRSAAARSWLDWGVKLDSPMLGCVVVLKRGKNPRSGHVTLYMGGDGDRLEGLGGNQSNQVQISRYKVANVLGYRWPAQAT